MEEESPADCCDAAIGAIIEAVLAADAVDFRRAQEHLSDANQIILSCLTPPSIATPAEVARLESLQETVEFFVAVFRAQSFRLERNPGKAIEALALAQQKSTRLLGGNVESILVAAVRNLSQPIPVQLPMCAASENLIRGNVDAARIDVQRAEAALFVWFDKIGIDVNRLDTAAVAQALDAQPLEAVIAQSEPGAISCC